MPTSSSAYIELTYLSVPLPSSQLPATFIGPWNGVSSDACPLRFHYDQIRAVDDPFSTLSLSRRSSIKTRGKTKSITNTRRSHMKKNKELTTLFAGFSLDPVHPSNDSLHAAVLHGNNDNLARELKSRSEWITKKTPTRERETNGGGRKREKGACSRAPAGRQDTPRQTENEGRKRGCLRDALVRSRPASARFAYHCLAQRSGPSHSPSAPFGSRGHMRGERRDFLSLASMFASRFYLFYSTIKKDSQKRRMTAKYWLPVKNYI